MTARTHDLAAVTAFAVYLLSVPLQPMTLGTLLVAVLANQIGGIAPDIDQPTAPFWRNLPVGKLFGRVFDKLLGGHRFITHSLLGVALFSGLMYLLLQALHPIIPSIDTQLVLIAFAVGMLSHLLMDTFTKEGVPWLLPIPIKLGFPPLKSARLTTGKLGETLFFVALLAFDGVYCWLHYHQILVLLHQYVT